MRYLEGMRLLFVLVTLCAPIGCAPADVVVVVTRDPPEAGAEDAAADTDPCRCDFHWTRIADAGDPPIACYTRGDCERTAYCEPTLPLSEEPSCHLR